MNIKDVFIKTINEVTDAFINEIKEMIRVSIQKISLDPDCIKFYMDIKKILNGASNDDASDKTPLIDTIVKEYKSNANSIKKKIEERSHKIEELSQKLITTNKSQSGGQGEGEQDKSDDTNTTEVTHKIIVEPDISSQIKVPKIKLMEDKDYELAKKNVINPLKTNVKSGIKTVTCAACGVRSIFITIRKKIRDMFEGNTNSILDTLFSIESPIFDTLKENIKEILDDYEKPIIINFAAIMLDKNLSIREIGSDEIMSAKKIKEQEQEKEKEKEKSQSIVENEATMNAEKNKDEQSKKDEQKKRKMCGGGVVGGGGGRRLRKKRGVANKTYKWRDIGKKINKSKWRGGRRVIKTLRIK